MPVPPLADAELLKKVPMLADELGQVIEITEYIVSDRLLEAVPQVLPVAVTVTEEVPAVVGVPLIAPVAAAIERPAGRPVADQE